MDGLCVYGGPFLHLVSGDLDEKWTDWYAVFDSEGTVVDSDSESGKWSADIEEKSTFGGYVGAQLDVTEQMKAFAEVMFTGDAWGIGIGTGWVF